MSIWNKLWETAKTVMPNGREATGDCIRDVTDPTLERAAARANEVVDHAAQRGRELLENGEARARRVVEDAEHACERATRRAVLRILIVGLVLVGAAGAVTVFVVWASQHLK